MVADWRIAAPRSVLSLFPNPPALLSLEVFQEIRSMLKGYGRVELPLLAP